MIDLVITHLTHPWGPPGTLETLGDPWRPLATMPENGQNDQNDRAGPHWDRSYRADHCHSGQADLQLSREVRSFNPQAVQSAMEIGDPAADPPVGIRPLHIGETSPTFVDTRDHLYDQGGSGKAPSRQSQSSCGIRLPRKSPNS